jgi:hypothetical protein
MVTPKKNLFLIRMESYQKVNSKIISIHGVKTISFRKLTRLKNNSIIILRLLLKRKKKKR